MSVSLVGVYVLVVAALLFCIIIALFIIPLVVERSVFYIPRLVLLVNEGSVYRKSIVFTVFEIAAWIAVTVAIYVFFAFAFPYVFQLVTVSPVALASWGVGALNMMYRFMHFNVTIKRDFYHHTYMHYVTPTALQEYQAFIDDLGDIPDEELAQMAERAAHIPYMHRQALSRRMRERGMVSSTGRRTEKPNEKQISA